jgi:GntR family transcriptional repressor for pyruvate dehydrogenase complex
MTDPGSMTFEHVPRRKLAETVAARILAAVRDQPPGTRLPNERDLTASLGVGRSTVREALNGLAMIGVIEIRHGQGVFVAEHTAAVPTALELGTVEAREQHEARSIIEVEIARLAAERRSDEQLAALEAILEEHRVDLEAGGRPVMQASRFHLLLGEAAGNRVLAGVLRPYFRLMFERGPALYEQDATYAAWEYSQHRAILDAVRDREPDRAAELMRAHVQAMTGHYAEAMGTASA